MVIMQRKDCKIVITVDRIPLISDKIILTESCRRHSGDCKDITSFKLNCTQGNECDIVSLCKLTL